jgi:predicted nucleic acid-binding protein
LPEAESIVINTGPLLALSRGQMLKLLESLPFQFQTTSYVLAELEAGLEAGNQSIPQENLRLVQLKTPIHASLASELHAGEASVIQAAMENSVSWVCIDELAGRFKATALGLNVVGTLGLLGRAKMAGLLDKLGPIIEQMTAGGYWFSEPLVRDFLKAFGE